MTTITPELAYGARPTPKKLGPAPALSANARDDYNRQLDFLVSTGNLPVRARDFLQAALYTYSDKAAKDFYPSQATMADLRRCSTRTIQRLVAAAKAAGVLKTAQLKGYNAASSSWFCSSNTHRISFVPEWILKRQAAAAARADQRRAERIAGKAQPKRNRDAESRPTVPELDAGVYELAALEAIPASEVPKRARSLRDVIIPPKPPPVGA